MGKYEELRDGLNNLLEAHGLNHVFRSVTCERSVLPLNGRGDTECYVVFHLPGFRGNMAYRSSDPAMILGLVDDDCKYTASKGLNRPDDGGPFPGPPPLPSSPEEPHAMLCFACGGSPSAEKSNSDNGFECPRCARDKERSPTPDPGTPQLNSDITSQFTRTVEAEKQRMRSKHTPEGCVSPELIPEEFTGIDQEIDVLRQRLNGCDEVMLSHADAIRNLRAKAEAGPQPARDPWAPFTELENRVAAMENPPGQSSPEYLELEARIAQLEKQKFKGLQGGS